ncbi:MAG: FAD-dependent oxidoreductase [Saprospiraceae bacterium]
MSLEIVPMLKELELNRLEDAGMLVSKMDGNKKVFQANTQHPLFSEIHNIILKHIGIDRVIANVVERLGEVERVYLVGDFSKGMDSQIIDLILIGDIDKSYLIKLVEKQKIWSNVKSDTSFIQVRNTLKIGNRKRFTHYCCGQRAYRMKQADVVIIGGGIVGLATAYQLLKKSRRG